MNKTIENEIAAPMICGVEITMDEVGRYNLNDLHAAAVASGDATASQRPSVFLRSAQVKRFIETLQTKALKSALEQNQQVTSSTARGQNCPLEQNQPLKIIKGGNAPGAWAVELLAIRYAAWIKPEFEIEVYQTFLDYRTGKLTTPAASNPNEVESLKRELKLTQDYLEQVLENKALKAEIEQIRAQPAVTNPHLQLPQPTSSAGEKALERERDELAAMLGRSKDYATISAVERVIEREFSWHPLRNWCLVNHQEPVYLKKYGCAWPRGAWLAVYRVDLEELFG